jgi:hypothetical protein
MQCYRCALWCGQASAAYRLRDDGPGFVMAGKREMQHRRACNLRLYFL